MLEVNARANRTSKRRFTVEHVFRAGSYRVMFKLKRREKPVASAGVSIQVRPGLRDIG